MKINLNDRIKVKLTDLGKDVYYHQFDDLNRINSEEVIKPRMPEEDGEGRTEFTLWRFIELYGEYVGMCQPNVIDPLDMEVME